MLLKSSGVIALLPLLLRAWARDMLFCTDIYSRNVQLADSQA